MSKEETSCSRWERRNHHSAVDLAEVGRRAQAGWGRRDALAFAASRQTGKGSGGGDCGLLLTSEEREVGRSGKGRKNRSARTPPPVGLAGKARSLPRCCKATSLVRVCYQPEKAGSATYLIGRRTRSRSPCEAKSREGSVDSTEGETVNRRSEAIKEGNRLTLRPRNMFARVDCTSISSPSFFRRHPSAHPETAPRRSRCRTRLLPCAQDDASASASFVWNDCTHSTSS